jgi:hypothetical protein
LVKNGKCCCHFVSFPFFIFIQVQIIRPFTKRWMMNNNFMSAHTTQTSSGLVKNTLSYLNLPIIFSYFLQLECELSVWMDCTHQGGHPYMRTSQTISSNFYHFGLTIQHQIRMIFQLNSLVQVKNLFKLLIAIH